MMNLYLMRHGLAVDLEQRRFSSDRERPLTPKGGRKLRQVAKALRKLDVSFEAVFSSPLVRARQTAEIVVEVMKCQAAVQATTYLAPGGRSKDLVKLLRNLRGSPQEILLVGHEPDLGDLASTLLSGGDDVRLVFKKGGIAKLGIGRLSAGRCATLEWLVTSQQLELMA